MRLSKRTWSPNVQKALEKMGPGIKNILQFCIKNGVQLFVYWRTLGEFQAFIIDFRSMTKHGNSVKPDISVHIAEAALSLAPY